LEDPLSGSYPGPWLPLWSLGLAIGITALASMVFAYIYFLLINFSRGKLLQLVNGDNKQKAEIEASLDRTPQILNAVVAVEITFKILFILCLYLFIVQSFDMDRVYGLIPTFLLSGVWFILFCRILPSEIGARHEERVLLAILPFLSMISVVFSPLLYPLLLFRRLAQHLTGPSTPDEEAEHFTEEIMDAVDEGEREGVIEEAEADMIESIVELHVHEVSAIMTTRMDMFCVEQNTDVADVVRQALESGHSRVPVYEETRDKMMGILYVKDLLAYWPEEGKEMPPLTALIRKPFFVPETKKISELLTEFRENKVHMAIVLDEYGGTAGLVTNEDVLEEIVGEIVDEYDHEEEDELMILGQGRAEASGKLRIDELNEEMELHLPESKDYDTVGGLISTRLGKVPAKGDEIRCENVVLTVLEASSRRIKRIGIALSDKDASDNSKG
jgi:putative hemolysin